MERERPRFADIAARATSHDPPVVDDSFPQGLADGSDTEKSSIPERTIPETQASARKTDWSEVSTTHSDGVNYESFTWSDTSYVFKTSLPDNGYYYLSTAIIYASKKLVGMTKHCSTKIPKLVEAQEVEWIDFSEPRKNALIGIPSDAKVKHIEVRGSDFWGYFFCRQKTYCIDQTASSDFAERIDKFPAYPSPNIREVLDSCLTAPPSIAHDIFSLLKRHPSSADFTKRITSLFGRDWISFCTCLGIFWPNPVGSVKQRILSIINSDFMKIVLTVTPNWGTGYHRVLSHDSGSTPRSQLSSSVSSINIGPDIDKAKRHLFFSSASECKKPVINMTASQYAAQLVAQKEESATDGPTSADEAQEMGPFSNWTVSKGRPRTDVGHRCGTQIADSRYIGLREVTQAISGEKNYDAFDIIESKKLDLDVKGPFFREVAVQYKQLKTAFPEFVFKVPTNRKHVWVVASLLEKTRSTQLGEAEAAEYIMKDCFDESVKIEDYKSELRLEYSISTYNTFDALTSDCADFETGDMLSDFNAVKYDKRVRAVTKGSYRAPQNNANVLHVAPVDKLNKDKTIRDERQKRKDYKAAGTQEERDKKVNNVLATNQRIKTRTEDLKKYGSLAIAKYTLRSRYISHHVFNLLTDDNPWMGNGLMALSKGLIYWAAFWWVQELTRSLSLAGGVRYLIDGRIAKVGSLSWVKDLTQDGDVENNPGPITVRSMKEIQDATTVDGVIDDGVKNDFPLQHWAHHRLTERAGDYGQHYGDLINYLVTSYSVQDRDGTIVENVSLPLRETQVYPRTIPMAEEDGGQLGTVNVIYHVIPDEEGFEFPGVRYQFRPGTPPPKGEPVERGVLVGPDDEELPVDENGMVDRRHARPAYAPDWRFALEREVYGVRGRRFNLVIADQYDLFVRLWDLFDGESLPVQHLEVREEEPDYGHLYAFQSGCPVLFVNVDSDPDSGVELLRSSRMTDSMFATIDMNTTRASHRPDRLIWGYRKSDIEMYIVNFRGKSEQGSGDSFGGPGGIKLDMTAFNMKFGLYLAWWSIRSVITHRGVNLAGQTQVHTPWVSVTENMVCDKGINISPIDNENCGGRFDPGFPFISGQDVRVVGQISFHLSLATVPKNKPIIWIPHECHDARYMSTIALLITCLCPYPLGNMGIFFEAEDGITRTRSRTFHNWTGGLLSVGGDLEIHVMWPRRCAIVIRPGDAQAVIDEVSAFRPYSGPEHWGDTPANHKYHLNGDAADQTVEPGRLLDFLLSWQSSFSEADFRYVTTYLSSKGVMSKSWHVIFDTLPIWATRTSTLTLGEDGNVGPPTAEMRAMFLADSENNVKSVHLYGNTVPKIPGNENWLTYVPTSYDGLIGPTQIDGIGAVLGGFAVGSGEATDHNSTILSMYSTTWIPMSLLAFRSLGTSIDLMLSYFKITPELVNHREDRDFVHETLREFYENVFPSIRIRDPKHLYYVDYIMAFATNGSYLRLCDNGRNLLRTVTLPRLYEGTIYSNNFAVCYSQCVAVKYPDVYFHQISEQIITDWAPFCVYQGGLASCGYSKDGYREYCNTRNVGPNLNMRYMPPMPTVRDICFLDGLSQWNSRLLLLTGEAVWVYYNQLAPMGDGVPAGELPCLRPWALDQYLRDNQAVSRWAWSNTIFFPTMRWNELHLVVLNVPVGLHVAKAMRVQAGVDSEIFYTWLLPNCYPTPIASDAFEKFGPGTRKILGLLRRSRYDV